MPHCSPAKAARLWFTVLVAGWLLTAACRLFIPQESPALPHSDHVAATLAAVQATQTALVSPPGVSPTTHPAGSALGMGSISGQLSFPGEALPAMRVVAFNLKTDEIFFVETRAGQAAYHLENLPPGTYSVVAYADSLAGGYSQAVVCGLNVVCKDHSLLTVIVMPNREASNINPGDWYAPPGTYPPNPVP